jgi:hypothetical protein
LGAAAITAILRKPRWPIQTGRGCSDGEVVHKAQVLEPQIRQIISVEQADLRALQEQQKEIDGNLRRLVGVDTSAALGFGSQLDADKVVLQIDISDVTFRLQALQDYLQLLTSARESALARPTPEIDGSFSRVKQ